MKRILLLDGNSVMNSSFYGMPLLSTSDGKYYTNAVTGTLNVLLKYIKELSPEYCAVAFDVKQPTFRHTASESYKAGRKPMPPELASQFGTVKECLEAIGVKIIECPGYEADDILGTCSAFARGKEDFEAYIITGDRDSFQLVRDNVFVIYKNPKGIRLIDRKGFSEEYPGVVPENFVDYKALVGDKSDNIKGVEGIGDKSALSLVSEYGSIEGIYENTDKLKGAQKTKIENGKEDAFFSRYLATILTDAPIGVTLDDLKKRPADKQKMKKIFSELQMVKIAETAAKLGAEEGEPFEEERKSEENALICEKIPGRIAVYNGRTSDGETERDITGEELAALLKDEKMTVVVLDSKKIYSEFGEEVNCRLFDVSLAAYVIRSSSKEQGIAELATEYFSMLPDEKTDGARLLYCISVKQDRLLDESGQRYVYEKIELPLAKVLADMEKSGFRVDVRGLGKFSGELQEMCSCCAAEIYAEAGHEFNINSPKQLGTVLFEELKLPHSKKTKSGYSTDSEVLEYLKKYHPIVENVIEYRKVAKLRSTYAEGLRDVAGEDGRIHSTFNQKVTATGRLSSSDPNLQNIPVRTELGKRMREYFIPDDGCVLVDADYSQIELRVLASVSGDNSLISSFLMGEDIHASTAASVFGVPLSAVTPEMRKSAKKINFGIVYGMSAFSLADDIGVSVYEAGEYIKQYFAGFPEVSAFLSESVEFAKNNGYVTTVCGRRRYIDEIKAPKHTVRQAGERIAKNSPIQGTAADIIKLAMINVSERLKKELPSARLILQVHDELILEAKKEDALYAEKILREEMEGAMELAVPLAVESGIGNNWLECH